MPQQIGTPVALLLDGRVQFLRDDGGDMLAVLKCLAAMLIATTRQPRLSRATAVSSVTLRRRHLPFAEAGEQQAAACAARAWGRNNGKTRRRTRAAEPE